MARGPELAQHTETKAAAGRAAMHGLPGLRRQLWLARFALWWERLWPALWPTVGLLGLFLTLALFDVLPDLPVWIHAATLALFAVALALTLWRGLKDLGFPDLLHARRRIEQHSELAHRPLNALDDRLVAGSDDPGSRALWELHQRRMRDSLNALKVGTPAPGLARRDPYALRAALLLLLTIGVVLSWSDSGNRILRALMPAIGGGAAGAQMALDIWITPPSYTGLAPIYLSREGQSSPNGAKAAIAANGAKPVASGAGEPIAVPVGSSVLAQFHGKRGTPNLRLGKSSQTFSAVDSANFKLTTSIDEFADEPMTLAVEQNGREIAGWTIAIVPDHEPAIAFSGPPAKTERGALRLTYEAKDDYGVVGATAFIRRTGEGAEMAGGPISFDLALPGGNTRSAKETSYHDLTAHPWAGLPVNIQLLAKDAIEQVGISATLPMVLPERQFRHPVARAIVEQRKQLTLNPLSRDGVRERLSDISRSPQTYNNDTVVFLALRTAIARLRLDKTPEAIAAVQALLWDTALRIEDGRLSLAERELRDIQRALQDALSRNADSKEIEKLMAELQQALNKFLESIMQNMQAMPQTPMPFDPNAQYLTPQDLQNMLDRARELAQSGSMDAAREMLAMLQELLESLRSGNFAMQQGGQQGQSQASEMMKMLQDLLKKQRELMEQTHRDAQQGQRGQPGQQGQGGQDGQGMSGADMQEALRRQLGELMRRLGEAGGQIPGNFGRAERSMRDATDALQQGQPGQAVGPQGNALDQLMQGAGQMMEQLMQQFGQGMPSPGDPTARAPRPGQRQFDPLGRPLPSTGNANSEDVRIPDDIDMQRAREILQELRRRAGEIERPQIERDYIDRLLRRF